MSTSVRNPRTNAIGQRQSHWNAQAVRGKVTTQCLWNACKALSIGLLLLAIGTSMAIVGYYADQLSIRSEIRGNSTVKIKNESRGFHLNNLSYAGPIVMGIGGFIVVAACVMTFEARDSATKVVPARFKPNPDSSVRKESPRPSQSRRSHRKAEAKRTTSCQTGLAKNLAMTGSERSPKNNSTGTKSFASALVQFSRELLENSLPEENRRIRGIRSPEGNRLNKSPSAPDLVNRNDSGFSYLDRKIAYNFNGKSSSPKTGIGSCRRNDAFRHPASISSSLLLRPNSLHRQALSMENPFYETRASFASFSAKFSRRQSGRSGGSKESFDVESDIGAGVGRSNSQTSMALDLHDCRVTLKVEDEAANKRSETAKRHQLIRQKPVEDDREDGSPKCISRFLFAPKYENGSDSTLNSKGSCHRCSRNDGKSLEPKIDFDIGSDSYSKCLETMKIECFDCEEETKIFCMEDFQRRKSNETWKNMEKICCEEKSKLAKRHRSQYVSPSGSPTGVRICHRLRIRECRECGNVNDFRRNRMLVRKNAKRSKSCGRRIEGSHSAEEENVRRGFPNDKANDSTAIRSASFSPTGSYSFPRSGGTTPTRKSPTRATFSESRKVVKPETEEPT